MRQIEWKPVKPEPMHCASCGICIGEGYDQTTPATFLGDAPICSFCNNRMGSSDFIQINDLHRLLKDGSIVLGRRQ